MKYGCDEKTGLLVVKKYSDPLSDQAFFYDPPTNSSFGGGAPQKVCGIQETYIYRHGPGVIFIKFKPGLIKVKLDEDLKTSY